jgi:hypothetical protein
MTDAVEDGVQAKLHEVPKVLNSKLTHVCRFDHRPFW